MDSDAFSLYFVQFSLSKFLIWCLFVEQRAWNLCMEKISPIEHHYLCDPEKIEPVTKSFVRNCSNGFSQYLIFYSIFWYDDAIHYAFLAARYSWRLNHLGFNELSCVIHPVLPSWFLRRPKQASPSLRDKPGCSSLHTKKQLKLFFETFKNLEF